MSSPFPSATSSTTCSSWGWAAPSLFWRDSAPAHRSPRSWDCALCGAPPTSSSSPSRGSHRAGGSVRPRHRRLGGRRLQPVSHRSPRVLLGAVRRLLHRPGEAVPPTKARPLGHCRQHAGGGPAGVPRRHAVPGHRYQEGLRGDCGRMGRARLLRHPGHRALLPLAGPRADAQASGGLLRRGRGRHPGPLRRGSADGNGRHGGRVPLARHNGQPKLNGAHHWRCSAGTARSTPLRRPQRHRHHERDVLRSLRIPRP